MAWWWNEGSTVEREIGEACCTKQTEVTISKAQNLGIRDILGAVYWPVQAILEYKGVRGGPFS